jgi:hypothetical protein
MSKEEQQTKRESAPGSLAKFLPGGEFGPMTNRQEYEQRLNALPPEQRESAEESTASRISGSTSRSTGCNCLRASSTGSVNWPSSQR